MGATLALGATTFIPGPRLPVLGGYPAATPRFAPPCAGADCGDPPGIDPPGFWVVLQENGLEFDALPGVLGGCFGSSLRFASMAAV